MRRLAVAAALLLVPAACFGPDPNVTESGKGLPFLEIDFPPRVQARSTHTATLTVENRGPGDMGSVVVAFASVGVAGASGPLADDLVPISVGGDNPAIASITPEPESVSDDGVVYVFGGLPEGETMTIEFEIVAPDTPGPAANSVSVYDGAESDRIRGLRLETLVTG